MIKHVNEKVAVAIMGTGDLNVGMDIGEDNFGYFTIIDGDERLGFIFSDAMDAFEIAYYIQQVGKVMMKVSQGEELTEELKAQFFKPFRQEVEGILGEENSQK